MEPSRAVLVSGGVVVAALVTFYLAWPRDRGAPAPATSAPIVAEPAPPVVEKPAVAATTVASTSAVPAAAPAVADAAASALEEAMKSPDPFVRRSAIESALARKDTSALPTIARVDLTENGYVAASAIDATGKLAALASEPEKRDAVRTLKGWLEQESKRKSRDAMGNTSILVDSLADTQSPEAIPPLVAALDSASLPLHIETRIVEALAALDAKQAAPSVERFVARVTALKPSDEMQQALAKEALETANATLAKWRGVQ